MTALPIIRLNPDLEIRRHDIADGQFCVIVDDFLKNPHELIEFASENAERAYIPEFSYPGMNMRLPDDMLIDFHRFVRTRMGKLFSFLRSNISLATGLSMITFRPDQLSNYQRLCHVDPPDTQGRRRFASLVYLFANEELGGTAFYRWKQPDIVYQALALENRKPGSADALLAEHSAVFRGPPRFITESNELAELLQVIPPRFNRMIFYSGEILHSAHITSPELLTTDYSTGRLTLNCFANAVPK